MTRPRLLMTAGFDRADHVLALAELLRRDGVSVAGLLVVSPYSLKRLRHLVRQRGHGFLRQAVPRLLGLGRGAATGGRQDALRDLMEHHRIEPQSLRSWASAHSVRYRTVPSFDAPSAVEMVADLGPDWTVYGGGGILPRALIRAAGRRVLNAHSGPLPEVRGMNACEWSVLLGYPPTVTIHVIDEGIDTGGVVCENPVTFERGDTIQTLRSRCVATGVQALHQVLLDPPAAPPAPRADAADHRQCFVLAPALREFLEARLASKKSHAWSNRRLTVKSPQ